MINTLSPLKDTKLSSLLLVLVFFITLFFQLTILFYQVDIDFKDRLSFLHKQGTPKLNNQYKLINDRLNLIKDYAELIADEISNIEGYNKSKINHVMKQHTIKELGVFQVRLLSINGLELIRYDLIENELVKSKKLQNKSNRYYFQEAKDKNFDDIYISKLDLNVEYGKIEKPYRHAIRTVKKIKIDNHIFYLIINYDLTKVLSSTFKTVLYDVFLIEKDNQINFHLDERYCFSVQKNLKLYLKDLISDDNQYITKKEMKYFPYEMVIMIKKSQLLSLYEKKKSAQIRILYTSLIISFLLAFILFVVFQYAHKISMNKSLKSINKDLKRTVEDEVEKNQIKDQKLLEKTRLAQMGEMISMIAHQWRQPLASISAISIDLKFKSDLNTFDLKQKQEALNYEKYVNSSLAEINELIENLTFTIDDFRNFYKPNKKAITENIEEAVMKSLKVIEKSLVNDNIQIIKEYKSEKKVEFYDGEMMQVILNILKNAQDNFNEKKTDNPYIKIITENNTISICDNGGGIKEYILDKVFDPYFSTKDAKNGTGLGLYMSKKIIEEHHNGKLNIKNVNDGVCFMIEIGKIEPSD